jgi:hypothetical protein
MPALVALVMAQLVFCGGLFTIAGRVGLEQLSWLLPARFGYAAGAATVGWQRSPTPEPDPFAEPTQHQWLLDMGALGAQAVVLVLLTAVLLARSVARGRR